MPSFSLIDISTLCPDILLDIRYASSNNFLGKPLYSRPLCFLHKEVALALKEVQEELKTMKLNLKIFDGYRPLSIQKLMWDAVQDERYISNPAKNKGRHTRGTAVDVTLVNAQGIELEMPTGFDDFSDKAHSSSMQSSRAALKNRALLREVMSKYRFHQLPTEWWHFDYEGWLDDRRFPALDVTFEELLP